MKWDQINTDWTQLSARLQEKWGDLTQEDFRRIAGSREQMIGVLQERYGYEKSRAETDLDHFIHVITS